MTIALRPKIISTAFDSKDSATTWHAFLRLHIENRSQGCALTRAQHKGPLRVQKAFYPEGRDLAHLYILHPPGGMVSGDNLNITATLNAKAQALFTAPGAGRAYRARPDGIRQQQNIALHADKGATIEWLPPENIIYPGARATLNTQVYLAPDSRYVGWEITSLGLPAQNAVFDTGEFEQRLEIHVDGKPILIDRLKITDQTRHLLYSKAGFQNCPIQGTLVAGPFRSADRLAKTLQQCRRLTCPETVDDQANTVAAQSSLPSPLQAPLSGITTVGNFIVLRSLGHCSDAMKKLFLQHWTALRPALLKRSACAPRIWAT